MSNVVNIIPELGIDRFLLRQGSLFSCPDFPILSLYAIIVIITTVLPIISGSWHQRERTWSCSALSNSATPWTVAYQALQSMGFSRQEYWSGLPFHSPGDLPNPGIEPKSPTLQADALPTEPPKACFYYHNIFLKNRKLLDRHTSAFSGSFWRDCLTILRVSWEIFHEIWWEIMRHEFLNFFFLF